MVDANTNTSPILCSVYTRLKETVIAILFKHPANKKSWLGIYIVSVRGEENRMKIVSSDTQKKTTEEIRNLCKKEKKRVS